MELNLLVHLCIFQSHATLFCSLRYVKPISELYSSRTPLTFFRQFCFSNVNNELKVAAANAREIVFIRDESLYVPCIYSCEGFLYRAITDLVT